MSAIISRRSGKEGGSNSRIPPEGIRIAGNIPNSVGHAQSLNRLLSMSLVVTLILLSVSLLANGALIMSRPAPRYFASTPDLRVLPLTPLDQPRISDPALANWAGNTVIETLSFDFVGYKDQLFSVQDRYTPGAFATLITSLKENQILSTILERRLILHTSMTGTPHVVSTAITNGRKTWMVEAPLLLSYESSNGVATTQRAMASIVVQRVSEAEYAPGVRIAQINVKVM